MKERYKLQSEQTAAYYNQFQYGYNEYYGDIIQAFRPTDNADLMQAIVTGADLRDGLYILDAGCGVAGPDIWLAAKYDLKIEGITISEVQVAEAVTAISQAALTEKIKIRQADFHELAELFPAQSFDRVLFLESLGHSGAPDLAISQSFGVLNRGGSIYIKDFYYKESEDSQFQERIKKTIANINRFYNYKTLCLTDTIKALRSVGFEIDFIRKFAFKDDIAIRFAFEQRFGIDIFDGELEFAPAEWLEIKCTKPF